MTWDRESERRNSFEKKRRSKNKSLNKRRRKEKAIEKDDINDIRNYR